MFLMDFPGPERTALDMDLVCREMAWSNMVALTSDSRTSSPATQGTLSIKCTFGGDEIYEVNGRGMRVSPSSYLILNHGQRYSSYIDSTTPVESLCIFFRPQFAEQALWSMTVPEEAAIDDPAGTAAQPTDFFERIYREEETLSPMLADLYRTLKLGRPERGWVEERFHLLMQGMLSAHHDLLRTIESIPAARPSTRMERFRRLDRGREFIEYSYNRRISLNDMAREACLSPHHFLRLFKRTFGRTPHQYLTDLRLRKAAHLLAATNANIMQICLDLGFESPSSFTHLFSRRFGVSPRRYREGAGK